MFSFIIIGITGNRINDINSHCTSSISKYRTKLVKPVIRPMGENISQDANAQQMYSEKCCTLGVYMKGERYFGWALFGAFAKLKWHDSPATFHLPDLVLLAVQLPQ